MISEKELRAAYREWRRTLGEEERARIQLEASVYDISGKLPDPDRACLDREYLDALAVFNPEPVEEPRTLRDIARLSLDERLAEIAKRPPETGDDD